MPLPEKLYTSRYFDAEHALAVGHRIPINCLDSYNIGLIPTLSDSVRSQIVEQKKEIIGALQIGTELSKALESLRGIGPKTSQLLTRYVTEVNITTCPQEFKPFMEISK